jgi:hypothetical protein
MRLALAASFLVALTAAVGCSAPIDADSDSTGAAAADLSASAPITLGNFVSHPKIKAIRAEVAAVDAAKMTSASKDLSKVCPEADGSENLTMSTDEANVVRKFVDAWGGSDGDSTTTYYFDAGGHLRFVYDVTETAPASGALYVVDSRVYFDELGAKIFEVKQEGKGTEAHPPAMANRPYQLPANGEGAILSDAIEANPKAYFDGPPKCE